MYGSIKDKFCTADQISELTQISSTSSTDLRQVFITSFQIIQEIHHFQIQRSLTFTMFIDASQIQIYQIRAEFNHTDILQSEVFIKAQTNALPLHNKFLLLIQVYPLSIPWVKTTLLSMVFLGEVTQTNHYSIQWVNTMVVTPSFTYLECN